MLKQFKLAEDILLQKQSTAILDYQELSILKNKPFWIWDKTKHREEFIKTNGQCCFNDIVGRPLKDGREYPLFDYEKILYDSLLSMEGNFKDKHLWVKKATGLGITEFMLRVMAWLCTSNNRIGKSQMCIVTGPNIGIATKLRTFKGNLRYKVRSNV